MDSINTKVTSPKIIEFEKWLDSFLNFEKTPEKNIFWLRTMEFFCKKLNSPEKSSPCFHVAGSKGKGSISLFIASILTEAGFKAGLYTSPHIIDFLERVTLAGNKLSVTEYEEAADELMAIVKQAEKDEFIKNRPVTWFELVTLFSFLSFRKAKCDYSVYEVGLGGRLDSTNVVSPLCECIGPIELEHTEFLGDTLEKIAYEKGGIIKKGTQAVIAGQEPSVKEVFRKIAEEQNAEIFFCDEEIKNLNFKINKESLLMETSFESRFFSRPVKADLKMIGRVQAENASLAALAVKLSLPEISEETIEKGLSKAALPCRFQVEKNPEHFENIPYLVLDGAHTVKSIRFTMDTMRESGLIKAGGKKEAVLLFACAADKDVKDIAPLFKDSFRKIFLTRPGNVKQSDPQKMINAFSEAGLSFDYDGDFKAQIKKALNEAHETKSVILVTGSFYLAAEALKLLGSLSNY